MDRVPLLTFEDATPDIQNIIEDVRIVLSDTNDDKPWFEGNNDTYVSLVRATIHEINYTQPFTYFTMNNFPMGILGGLLHLGLTVKAIEARMNQWVETPSLSGFSGPYADESGFLQRWQSRLSEILPYYKQYRSATKLIFLPHGAATVGMMYPSVGGIGYEPVPIFLRGMPSWYMIR